ncbi:SCP domain-containing protein [Aphelenchoides fujianensis]|nr:SCP domain-containing protein [Aphelenchoides fujianensis]
MAESDDLFAEEFVAAQNFYRRLHGVPELQLSQELTDAAQRWAEKLASRRHLSYYEKSGIGENITFFPIDMSASDIVEYWYKENRRYDYDLPGWHFFFFRQVGTNYFTQLIWRCTKEVGVGCAPVVPSQTRNPKTGQLVNDSLNDHQVVVAFYRPSGNNNRAGQFALNVVPPLPENSDSPPVNSVR